MPAYPRRFWRVPSVADNPRRAADSHREGPFRHYGPKILAIGFGSFQSLLAGAECKCLRAINNKKSGPAGRRVECQTDCVRQQGSAFPKPGTKLRDTLSTKVKRPTGGSHDALHLPPSALQDTAGCIASQMARSTVGKCLANVKLCKV